MRLNREAILDRWAAGKTAAEIAAELGYHPGSVGTCIRYAREDGDERAARRVQGQSAKPSRNIAFRLSAGDAAILFAVAHSRRSTPTALCRRLIEVIIRDCMFQAVLDTRGGK